MLCCVTFEELNKQLKSTELVFPVLKLMMKKNKKNKPEKG